MQIYVQSFGALLISINLEAGQLDDHIIHNNNFHKYSTCNKMFNMLTITYTFNLSTDYGMC